jgi:hypothetical protein
LVTNIEPWLAPHGIDPSRVLCPRGAGSSSCSTTNWSGRRRKAPASRRGLSYFFGGGGDFCSGGAGRGGGGGGGSLVGGQLLRLSSPVWCFVIRGGLVDHEDTPCDAWTCFSHLSMRATMYRASVLPSTDASRSRRRPPTCSGLDPRDHRTSSRLGHGSAGSRARCFNTSKRVDRPAVERRSAKGGP